MKLRLAPLFAGLASAGLLVTGLFAAFAGHAQAPTTPPAVRPVVLKAAHLFDGRSGRMVENGMVLVQGERIVSAGANVAVPDGARVIDLGDATLLPGFIDAHTHIADDHDDDWAAGIYNGMMRFPAEQAFHAQRNAKVTLDAGFTTIRVLGAGDFIDVALRNAINGGYATGPRMIVAGHAIGSTGGHCDSSPYPPTRVIPSTPMEGVCNGAEQCREATRLQMKYGADVIKICASGGVLSESDPVDVPQLTPDELKAIISEAHNWGRKVAAHAHGDTAARLAIEAGVDSIEHGSFLKPETLQLMKQKGVYLVPTRTTLLWTESKLAGYPPKIAGKAHAAYTSHEQMLRNAIRIGTPIALGTDAAVFPHGLNGREFGDYVDVGMSPAAALMTSSIGAATLLGVEKDVGTLEAGKYADVVAVPGNVLTDIRATEHPVFVMKNGQVVRGAE
ncbi:amidohydrolase family protein [Lysobacter sp. TY2-98]|uniref:metal-dependent hydrolase family protein n=1 Tax=Lysobacter sp. TY2-98 TaxID=2290922 RepID=UPI000E204445|nr:amidohydrolase family protein [Lysobacter sp. TY2-98]AXK72794.1 amidohydrolase family protein [Lysobacter sp. TY2-98]